MKPEQVVLRFGELTLKGRNRHRFEKSVLNTVRGALRPWRTIQYNREFGRIVLRLGGADYEALIDPLRRIFGLSSFSPAYTAALDTEELKERAVRIMRQANPAPATFKVNVRRANKNFPIDSQEMNRIIGGAVLRAFPDLKVDVHRPDVELKIELRETEALLYSQVKPGAGGFPYGSNGKAMLMLSGGIDSPVAGYLAMRQGLALEAVHFHSYPYTSERSQQKVKDLLAKLCGYAGPIKLHMVPFTSLQTRIHGAYRENLLITLLRRSMMRITERLAEASGAGAIVTGESLGQVASQTLPSMNAIGSAVQLPLIRPLVCMEKQEIIRIAESIGTYELSILPYEDCCTLFLPPSPSTNPNPKVVRSIESHMNWLEEEIEAAVKSTETVVIDPLAKRQDETAGFF
ncbi:tRNA 4-thiouridine(8) synthase ThiI [Paenibacillus filicis]|uniref:Probable tRNA sulfurtransferase n=1 Tax=Paenibacillus gyeongsangnamensis TaxID=3388067 RepID=A0ABT4Q2T9_9BACL|nr:tRNA uracil 4-sulfurtransferase ThiI [Paenibacillus filicis]MCZ8511197.1 tRNA 4-thiouridine(8) synthase ThiI [Paenibacillus filicis]